MKHEYGFLLGDELLHVGRIGEGVHQLLPGDCFKLGTPQWSWTTCSPTTLIHMVLKPRDFQGVSATLPYVRNIPDMAVPVVIITTREGDSLLKEYKPVTMPKLLSQISDLLPTLPLGGDGALGGSPARYGTHRAGRGPNGGHIVDTSIVTGYCTRTIHLYHCPVARIGTMYASPMSIGGRYFDIVDGKPVVYECIAYASKEECLLLKLDQQEVAVGLMESCASATERSGLGMLDDDSTLNNDQAI